MSDVTMSTGDASRADEAVQSPETCVSPSPRSRIKSEDGSDIETKPKGPEGGRLQFYFDGKIVLELSDRRENGKTWWVPVTQKTYWPPPPPSCSGSTVRQESSASFSVSDESSVQSSPWLRETRWKNSNPKKRTPGEGFTLYIKGRERCRYQWSQRRRPFRWTEQQCHVRPLAECTQCRAVQWKKKTRPANVATVTTRLLDKALSKKMMASTASASMERGMESLVSPRKRLLRDMEKVRLNDRPSSCNVLKKAKALMPATPLPTHSAAVMAAAVAAHQPSKVYDRQSSYSIDSLLNKQEEAQQQASCSSSFLRSLLRKAPATTAPAPPVVINGTRNKSLRANNSLDLARPHQPVVWLPYPIPPPPFAATTSSAAQTAARPGPSGRPTPPVCNDSDDDDVPLNLTIRRAREHS